MLAIGSQRVGKGPLVRSGIREIQLALRYEALAGEKPSVKKIRASQRNQGPSTVQQRSPGKLQHVVTEAAMRRNSRSLGVPLFALVAWTSLSVKTATQF
ncbi:hypothetical protein KM043_008402 [Ampulex compressa]|nr:hypothetical protein KM043_008402 [Ampulex compressa]